MGDPQVTVAIPTLNRRSSVEAALTSVLDQLDDSSVEVLILDNGCDQELRSIVDLIPAPFSGVVRYVPVPEVGLHNCRHAAARRGRGEILALLDDDVVVEAGWVRAILEAFQDPTVSFATGPIRPLWGAAQPAWLESFWTTDETGCHTCGYLSLIDCGPHVRDVDPNLVFGANFAVRRSTVFELGGFNPDAVPWELRRFRGDGETGLTERGKARGLRALYHPQARVNHRVPATRLAEAYFERRSFLQGISDSFRDCRIAGGSAALGRVTRYQPVDFVLRAVRTFGHRVCSASRRGRIRQLDAPGVSSRVARSYLAGYSYHRRLIFDDPIVASWVDRLNYWDAELPLRHGEGLRRRGH